MRFAKGECGCEGLILAKPEGEWTSILVLYTCRGTGEPIGHTEGVRIARNLDAAEAAKLLETVAELANRGQRAIEDLTTLRNILR